MKDKDEEYKKAVGDRYCKERLKLDQAKSPSFLTNPIKKRKIILGINVSISPTKFGKICIYEGDDLQ